VEAKYNSLSAMKQRGRLAREVPLVRTLPSFLSPRFFFCFVSSSVLQAEQSDGTEQKCKRKGDEERTGQTGFLLRRQ